MDPAECLRRYFDELAHCIHCYETLSLVTAQLYSKGVITLENRSLVLNHDHNETITPSYKLITAILTEVEDCITKEPHKMGVVLEVLNSHESFRNVAVKMNYMIANRGKAPPLTAHSALRLLQDSRFNVTKHWHQVGGDLGVSLDERRRLQELAIRTQNYDGALEECLDWWISNVPEVSWDDLVLTIERYEVSTSDRMRDLLNLPRIQRSNSHSRSSKLPRQGSSYESVGDPAETNPPSAGLTPISHTPSPSSATTGASITTDLPHPQIKPDHTLSINDLSGPFTNLTVDSTSSADSSPLLSQKTSPTPSPTNAITARPNTLSATATPLSTKEQAPFHMECQLINGSTKQVIKSSHTSQADVKAPIYRDIRLKRLTKYTTVPPLTPLIVTVTANECCYLYIINIGSSGNVSTLVPNEVDDDNRVEPGVRVQFPPREAEYEFELDSNSGTEIVVVLGYRSKVSIEDAKIDCKKMRENKVVERDIKVVERDITIKKKRVVPIGSVEMQFSVRPIA